MILCAQFIKIFGVQFINTVQCDAHGWSKYDPKRNIVRLAKMCFYGVEHTSIYACMKH